MRLEALFEHARNVEAVSDVTRARALARARATIAATPVPSVALPSSGRAPRWRIVVAVAGAFILGATGAATAFFHHAATAPTVERPVFNLLSRSERTAEPRAPLPKLPPRRQAHGAAVHASNAGEIRLLARAQVAYADGDFAEVLDLVAEHARRFSGGQLAEEREALRVQSLLGCGRLEDARRAAGSFADRFPHSVLLPRLQGAVGR